MVALRLAHLTRSTSPILYLHRGQRNDLVVKVVLFRVAARVRVVCQALLDTEAPTDSACDLCRDAFEPHEVTPAARQTTLRAWAPCLALLARRLASPLSSFPQLHAGQGQVSSVMCYRVCHVFSCWFIVIVLGARMRVAFLARVRV